MCPYSPANASSSPVITYLLVLCRGFEKELRNIVEYVDIYF